LNSKQKLLLLSLAAVFFATLGIYLGFWQLGRAAQKEVLQAAMEQQASKPPLAQAVLLNVFDADAVLHQRVLLSGSWVPQSTVYLDNRQMDGKVGFFVLSPCDCREVTK
jgi:surfeit locus 1 family protein